MTHKVYIAGTITVYDIRSVDARARKAAVEYADRMRTVHPPAQSTDRNTATKPLICAKGMASTARSFEVSCRQRTKEYAEWMKPRWERRAPLGFPVVPDV